jgi:hypothetical protein
MPQLLCYVVGRVFSALARHDAEAPTFEKIFFEKKKKKCEARIQKETQQSKEQQHLSTSGNT